eukprot:Awhi_evm2s2661
MEDCKMSYKIVSNDDLWDSTTLKSTMGLSCIKKGMHKNSLNKFGLKNCRNTTCQMIEELKKQDKITYECDYNGIIGSLQYLANGTRPDNTTAVNKLSQHSTTYGEEHWKAALRVLKYISCNLDYGLKVKKLKL